MYGKPKDKKKCTDKFLKLDFDQIEKIFATLPNYLKINSTIQYRKDPATYLNNECWNDEITAKPFHSPDVPDRTTVRPLYTPTAKDLD